MEIKVGKIIFERRVASKYDKSVGSIVQNNGWLSWSD